MKFNLNLLVLDDSVGCFETVIPSMAINSMQSWFHLILIIFTGGNWSNISNKTCGIWSSQIIGLVCGDSGAHASQVLSLGGGVSSVYNTRSVISLLRYYIDVNEYNPWKMNDFLNWRHLHGQPNPIYLLLEITRAYITSNYRFRCI